MAQENGRLEPSGLKALSVGGRLTPGAADAFEQLRTAGSRAGVTVTVTSAADAYRLYEIQERIFTERYQTAYTEYAPGKVDKRSWQGRSWFRRAGTAAAAVPGTSNHGWALAVDIANVGGFNSTFYRWLTATAPLFGFSNTEGASVGEAWHWVYSPTLHASHGGGTSAPAPTPIPTPKPEEEDMTPEQDARLKAVEAKVDALTKNDIVFFQSGTTTFEASLSAGTYRAFTNSADLKDRKYVLATAGVAYINWAGLVANPNAFGKQV